MRKGLLVVFALFSACETNTCKANADCDDGKTCLGGQCFSTDVMPGECTAGQTRSCGNANAVGACTPGTQRCTNGKWATACAGEVKPGSESCVDDDCDGQVDEGTESTWYPDRDGDGDGHGDAQAFGVKACAAPTGHVATNDDCNDSSASVSPSATERCTGSVDEDCDGTVNEGCGCATPGSTIPCCSGRGMQTCGADGMLGTCSATTSAETCNDVDDNCDGQVDEGSSLCGQGQACTNGACSCAPSAEACDGVDNDCDGTIDNGARVDTDGGTLVIDGGVVNADGSCTVGQGACMRTGSAICVAGGPACTASVMVSTETCNGMDDDCDGTVDNGTPAQLCPHLQNGQCTNGSCTCRGLNAQVCNGVCVTGGAEVCDGQDNDCDGTIDEDVTVDCYADTDNDRYADNMVVVKQCPVPGLLLQQCPSGWVNTSRSLGIDCAPNDKTKYATVSGRMDSDRDARCVGTAQTFCIGTTYPTDYRPASECAPNETDCNDSDISKWQNAYLRKDEDRDAYCVGAQTTQCIGATVPTGFREAGLCAATDDCSDTDEKRWYLGVGRIDRDGDGWCAFANTIDVCLGIGTNNGWRPASQCLGTDCKDDNLHATAACTLQGAYTTSYVGHTCPQENRRYDVLPQTTCGVGFHEANYRGDKRSGGGNCNAVDRDTVLQSCNGLEGATCRVLGDCVAD